MKQDLAFLGKMFVLTIFVVFLMQIRLGGKTLEYHFDTWLKNSIVVDYMQEATDGAVALGKSAYQKVDNQIHMLMGKWNRRKSQGRSLNIITRHSSEEEEQYDQPVRGSEAYSKTQEIDSH